MLVGEGERGEAVGERGDLAGGVGERSAVGPSSSGRRRSGPRRGASLRRAARLGRPGRAVPQPGGSRAVDRGRRPGRPPPDGRRAVGTGPRWRGPAPDVARRQRSGRHRASRLRTARRAVDQTGRVAGPARRHAVSGRASAGSTARAALRLRRAAGFPFGGYVGARHRSPVCPGSGRAEGGGDLVGHRIVGRRVLDEREDAVGEEPRGADGAAAPRDLGDLDDPTPVRDGHLPAPRASRDVVGAAWCRCLRR